MIYEELKRVAGSDGSGHPWLSYLVWLWQERGEQQRASVLLSVGESLVGGPFEPSDSELLVTLSEAWRPGQPFREDRGVCCFQ